MLNASRLQSVYNEIRGRKSRIWSGAPKVVQPICFGFWPGEVGVFIHLNPGPKSTTLTTVSLTAKKVNSSQAILFLKTFLDY